MSEVVTVVSPTLVAVAALLFVAAAFMLEDTNCVPDDSTCKAELCDGGMERLADECSLVPLEGCGARDDSVIASDAKREDVGGRWRSLEDSAAIATCVEDETASLMAVVELGASRDTVLGAAVELIVVRTLLSLLLSPLRLGVGSGHP